MVVELGCGMPTESLDASGPRIRRQPPLTRGRQSATPLFCVLERVASNAHVTSAPRCSVVRVRLPPPKTDDRKNAICDFHTGFGV